MGTGHAAHTFEGLVPVNVVYDRRWCSPLCPQVDVGDNLERCRLFGSLELDKDELGQCYNIAGDCTDEACTCEMETDASKWRNTARRRHARCVALTGE